MSDNPKDRLYRVIGELAVATTQLEIVYEMDAAMCYHDSDVMSDFIGPQHRADRHKKIEEIILSEFDSFESFNNALDTEFPDFVASQFKTDMW